MRYQRNENGLNWSITMLGQHLGNLYHLFEGISAFGSFVFYEYAE